MSATHVITGAAGFIGSHLSRALLASGGRVIGIDNFDPFYDRGAKEHNVARTREMAPAGTFELIEADVRDQVAMTKAIRGARPRAVFHLAALAGVRPSIADPARYVSVNVDGTASVLEACRSAGCREVIFASSSSVYGNNTKLPFAETDPVDEPISPYAATKRSGELICHTYARLFGLRIAALRFFTVYGPAQRPDLAISMFMRRIALGERIPVFGDGSSSRDYTYIDDIIAGVIAAHDHLAAANDQAPDPGLFRIFNLGGSRPVALIDMIRAIAEVVGRTAEIEWLAPQPGDVERTWADMTRSCTELSFQATTLFSDGLRSQWDWLRPRLQAAHGVLAG